MAKNIFTKTIEKAREITHKTKPIVEKETKDDLTMKGTMVTAGVAATGIKTVTSAMSSKNDSNMTRSDERTQKEFEKTDKTLRDIQTEQQQRGGDRDIPQRIIESPAEKHEHIPQYDKFMEQEAERVKKSSEQRANEQHRQMQRDDMKRHERLQDSKENAMIHDMTEQVLGRTYKVPGTNISYDDAAIMAKNNIRDSDELTGISLEDDGFENSVEEVQQMMHGYVFNGVPDIEEFYDMTKNEGPDVIAQAYVNVAKECDKSNIQALTKIDEKFCFEHQTFERQFDYIREHDPVADRVLNVIEMEMGRDRADD